MSDFRSRLLTGVGAVLATTAVGCATEGAAVDKSLAATAGDVISIHLDKGTARIGSKEMKVEKCSTTEYLCVEVPGELVLSFPRRCDVISGAAAGRGPHGGVKRVAPMPHLPPPSGTYVVLEFPRHLLFYDARIGFTEMRKVRHSPFERGFNPSDYEARFRIAVHGPTDAFLCK